MNRGLSGPQSRLGPTSLRSILILSSNLRLGLPTGFSPARFPTNSLPHSVEFNISLLPPCRATEWNSFKFRLQIPSANLNLSRWKWPIENYKHKLGYIQCTQQTPVEAVEGLSCGPINSKRTAQEREKSVEEEFMHDSVCSYAFHTMFTLYKDQPLEGYLQMNCWWT